MCSREQFEKWYLETYFDGDKDCGLEWLFKEPCGSYRYERPSTQWKIWQASRGGLQVDLSEALNTAQTEYESELTVYNQCVDAIEAAGLKVK